MPAAFAKGVHTEGLFCSMQKPQISVEKITPEIAIAMLARNTGNRPLRKAHVTLLASDMKAGNWKFDGSPIRFGPDGVLIDGQHRLKAVEDSGVTIESLVIRDLGDVFSVIDTGAKRQAADTLHIRGEINATILAAALCAVDRYETGKTDGAKKYSTQDIEALLESHPTIRGSAQVATNCAKKGLPPSALAACHYIFSKFDTEAAGKFFTDLHTGVNLKHGDPVLQLRERLLRSSVVMEKLRSSHVMALMIKAWNLRRGNMTTKKLSFSPVIEKFPVAI